MRPNTCCMQGARERLFDQANEDALRGVPGPDGAGGGGGGYVRYVRQHDIRPLHLAAGASSPCMPPPWGICGLATAVERCTEGGAPQTACTCSRVSLRSSRLLAGMLVGGGGRSSAAAMVRCSAACRKLANLAVPISRAVAMTRARQATHKARAPLSFGATRRDRWSVRFAGLPCV